jgi:hypothetical protein
LEQPIGEHRPGDGDLGPGGALGFASKCGMRGSMCNRHPPAACINSELHRPPATPCPFALSHEGASLLSQGAGTGQFAVRLCTKARSAALPTPLSALSALCSLLSVTRRRATGSTRQGVKPLGVACAELAQWGRPWCSYRTLLGCGERKAAPHKKLSLSS